MDNFQLGQCANSFPSYTLKNAALYVNAHPTVRTIRLYLIP